MKIEMAANSGFCMGVRNAILKIVDELNSSDEKYMYMALLYIILRQLKYLKIAD
jgi:4-hydroxy-3-methylbut-2-enyl diphosphate reductase IspH